MDEGNKSQEVKTPLSVIMDMAGSEIGDFVVKIMQTNNIPPFMMCYIIKDVLCDVQKVALQKSSDEFLELQKAKGDVK